MPEWVLEKSLNFYASPSKEKVESVFNPFWMSKTEKKS